MLPLLVEFDLQSDESLNYVEAVFGTLVASSYLSAFVDFVKGAWGCRTRWFYWKQMYLRHVGLWRWWW